MTITAYSKLDGKGVDRYKIIAHLLEEGFPFPPDQSNFDDVEVIEENLGGENSSYYLRHDYIKHGGRILCLCGSVLGWVSRDEIDALPDILIGYIWEQKFVFLESDFDVSYYTFLAGAYPIHPTNLNYAEETKLELFDPNDGRGLTVITDDYKMNAIFSQWYKEKTTNRDRFVLVCSDYVLVMVNRVYQWALRHPHKSESPCVDKVYPA